MYWPTTCARILDPPSILGAAHKLRSNRRGNLFATLSDNALAVWDVRPTVVQAIAVRSQEHIKRFGSNKDVYWTYDGKGLVILTTTSHLVTYQLAPTTLPAYESTIGFSPGPGEGDVLMGYELRPKGIAFVMGECQAILAEPHHLVLTLKHPPALLTVPFPIPAHLLSDSHFPPLPLDGEGEAQVECELWDLGKADWIDNNPVPLLLTRLPPLHTLTTNDGRAYIFESTGKNTFKGQIIHPPRPSTESSPVQGVAALGLVDEPTEVEDKAISVALNPRFGIAAIALSSGQVNLITVSSRRLSHSLRLKHSANLRVSPGAVTCMAWTSDGYALAVGHERGWAVWSMGGRLGGWGIDEDEEEGDAFMKGIDQCFWSPGNLELFVLCQDQLFVIPFAKSATTSQHSPDNTRYAFLQMDDRVLVYRGADQPDMSVINPESDVWQHIKIPTVYIATNWPIRYASISSDGKLIAVAGRRGLTHYSAASGRWKLFAHERDERSFTVRGGLLWFHHVLIAAVEIDRSFQIRLYSRDLDLEQHLHAMPMPSPVLVMSLFDNSLLVYTADNTLYHFLILPTQDSIRLHLCGSINFEGIVTIPTRVRALSWLVPLAQKQLGDPADDLIVATIIFLVDGKLVLLRPRRAGNDQVRYDMQILADRIESYWTHLYGVGTLENSLWGYDGSSMRVWLDALTIEATQVDSTRDAYETVEESVKLDLDFYPLSILMDKGIIIGVDPAHSSSVFKIQTSTHLFLPQFLRYHLRASRLDAALAFASNYDTLVYFTHSLEVLLHSVLEEPALPAVVEFLDHFSSSLDVVVACARKTEVERWGELFKIVGSPRELFERCLDSGALRTAASYLLVLHNLEELDDVKDTIRLLRRSLEAKEYQLCKELLRFLHSIDDSGDALRAAIADVGISPTPIEVKVERADRATSPFQLRSERLWVTPPSPKTATVGAALVVPDA